jgi:hypothetical protein
MHVELPKAKKFKEFGGEYVMIVISIATALALEHAVQAYHHRHQAHEASEKIEAELRFDLKEIDGAISHNEAEQKRVFKLRNELLAGMRRGDPDKELLVKLAAANRDPLKISVHTPTLRREAWEVAVANQSAGWMEREQLEKYAALYSHMRDIQAISNGSGNKFFDGPQLVNVQTDLQVGRAGAADVLRALTQVMFAYGSENGNLVELREDFAKTLEGASTGNTTVAAHP